jgi:hypothetical protein
MSYYKDDPSKKGLIFSAYQSLHDDLPALLQNAKDYPDPNKDHRCVKVNLITDGYNNKDTGYISTKEYEIWKKKNPPIFSEGFTEGHCGHGGRSGGYHEGTGHSRGFVGNYGSGEGPEARYFYPNYLIYDEMVDDKRHENNQDLIREYNKLNQQLTISDDIITSFFLGSITVLGLFLIYRMFDRMPKVK